MSVSKNRSVREASLAGGLSPEEAEELTDLDPSTLESGGYSPSDIPALGAYIDSSQEQVKYDSLPAGDAASYIHELLENPDEFVPDWDLDVIAFENMASTVKAKHDEYTIRTVYALEGSLDQELIDSTVRTIVDQPNYKQNTSPNSDDGNLGLVLGQYIDVIQEIVEDEDVISGAYSTIESDPESSAAAAANVPVQQLPENIRENIFTGGTELQSGQITTRIRSTNGAGRCGGLEEGHEKVLLEENPTRNATLISLEDELVGSFKYDGDPSMIAFQDIQSNGKQVLQAGMAYRISHSVLDNIDSNRAQEEQETYDEWELAELDRLELRPLRFAGERGDYTIQEFRQQIETRREELNQELVL